MTWPRPRRFRSLIRRCRRSHAIGAPTENSAAPVKNDCESPTGEEERKRETHSDPLKLLSDTIPFGSLPRLLAASLHIWRWNMKGFLFFFEGWRYCRLVDVLPPAGCFNHRRSRTRARAHGEQPHTSGKSSSQTQEEQLGCFQRHCFRETAGKGVRRKKYVASDPAGSDLYRAIKQAPRIRAEL